MAVIVGCQCFGLGIACGWNDVNILYLVQASSYDLHKTIGLVYYYYDIIVISIYR